MTSPLLLLTLGLLLQVVAVAWLLGRVRRRAAREVPDDGALDRAAWTRALVDALPVAVLLFPAGVSGVGTLANRTALELFGELDPPATGLGRRLRRPDGTRLAEGEGPDERALRGEAVDGERLLLARDDGSTPLHVDARTIRHPSGRILAALVTARELSGASEAERVRAACSAEVERELRPRILTLRSLAAGLTRYPDTAPGLAEPLARIEQSADELADRLRVLVQITRSDA
jgi:hypothetical protein